MKLLIRNLSTIPCVTCYWRTLVLETSSSSSSLSANCLPSMLLVFPLPGLTPPESSAKTSISASSLWALTQSPLLYQGRASSRRRCPTGKIACSLSKQLSGPQGKLGIKMFDSSPPFPRESGRLKIFRGLPVLELRAVYRFIKWSLIQVLTKPR